MGTSKKMISNSLLNGTLILIATADIVANNMFKNKKLKGSTRYLSKNVSSKLIALEINMAYKAKNINPINGE
jgi:hypothetical protein